MKKYYKIIIVISVLIIGISGVLYKNYYFTNNKIKINYPIKNALFPADFTSPNFRWVDKKNDTKSWKIAINTSKKKNFIEAVVDKQKWTPSIELWDSIKKYSYYEDVEIVIERNDSKYGTFFNDKAKTTIKISKDIVGAPILYREIPVPFSFAEKHIDKTSYKIVNVSSNKPPYESLAHFPVCGNCHSFNRDGTQIGLDFDAVSRDKGRYFVAPVDTVLHFNKDNYISWSKKNGKATFGLLSRTSWSGRYVVTTVKDRVVSRALETDDYSQIFFPVNGVLAIYDTETGKMWELPGANDTAYVQSNAVWTADDKYIIFARAKALPYPDKKSFFDAFLRDEKMIKNFIDEKTSFKYELYMIPFNNGKGGKAIPIKGASNNGKSNYFPTVSPDGKWLVYCQANNFMMLRPDSRLFIIPLNGGKARRLECNFDKMNSWHSWSPNSKWLVFVSKALDMYSNMYLTHIDDNGHASIPILIDVKKGPTNAINYPEFINKDPNYTFRMDYNFVNLMDIRKALENNNKKKAKELLDIYFKQGIYGSSLDYKDLVEIYTQLGDIKQAKRFEELFNVTMKTYNTGY
jgi:hypothetical protein